jgi:hypothetical protein
MKPPQKLASVLRPPFVAMAVTLGLLCGYLVSVGAVYYLTNRLPALPLSFRVLEGWCRPAESLALRWQPYWRLLNWCAGEGLDAYVQERDANKSLHSTPR